MRPVAPLPALGCLLACGLLAACRSAAPSAPAAEARRTAADAHGTPPPTDHGAPDNPHGPDAGEPGTDGGASPGDTTPPSTAPDARTDEAAGSTPLFVLLGGDLMAHPQVQQVAAEHARPGDPASGWAWLLRELAPLRERLTVLGRLVFVANLEFPVAVERQEQTRWPPRFNAPPEALAGFRAAGIDVVTVANNHAYDQHRPGLAETVAAAHAAGLTTVGAGTAQEARTPAVLSDAGPRVLLLDYAWTQQPPDAPEDDALPRVAVLEETIAPDVRAAAEDSDVLIVVAHWVGEFQPEPLPPWREWVERLAGWGADAVVCHGPHVVGPVELLELDGRAVPVVFSLGNLVSNMGWGVHPGQPLQESRDSEFRVEAREEALAVLRIVASPDRPDRPWALDGLWMIPLWLEDNRPLVDRRGPLREIFPRPMPWCRVEAAAGCYEGASERWCAGLQDLVLGRRAAVFETMWGEEPAPLAPCPDGANPYDPPPDFRPIGGAGAGPAGAGGS